MQKESIIYKLDYLTSRPHLYIYGNTKLRTKFGTIISSIVFFLFVSFTIYLLSEFFTRKHLAVIYSKETSMSSQFNLSDTLLLVNIKGKF